MNDALTILRQELAGHEEEAARLRAAISILEGTTIGYEHEDGPEDSYEEQKRQERQWQDRQELIGDLGEAIGRIDATRRVRHPELQEAIDNQAPSVAIPRGTKLYCSQGCVNGEAGGFTDQMALRTHCKRQHDREPTEAEKVPR